MKDSDLREYNETWLQYDRPQPMYDNEINKFYDDFYCNNPVHTSNLDSIFKEKFVNWLINHEYSCFQGIEEFKRLDIINGCTQYIDDLYQRYNTLQIFENDYKYHWRLNPNIVYTTLDNLIPKKDLLISMPFPFYGDVHPNMDSILNKCLLLNIPVHIDGAWISCIKNINFNFAHPAISSFAVSLSKGGLGGNRIGIRFSKTKDNGPITLMNDFNMNSQALVSMGINFIDRFGTEYFWKKYNDEYYKICNDFNLIPTKAIHIAFKDNSPVGIRPLLRFLKINSM